MNNKDTHLVFGLHPTVKQGAWLSEDQLFGPSGQSAVRYESDFVFYKPIPI